MGQLFGQVAVFMATLWVMGLGFAFVLQSHEAYLRWSGRRVRALAHWVARTFVGRPARAIVRWVLAQLWRFVRWGIPALARGIAGLFT